MKTKNAVRPTEIQRTVLNVERTELGAGRIEDAITRLSDGSTKGILRVVLLPPLKYLVCGLQLQVVHVSIAGIECDGLLRHSRRNQQTDRTRNPKNAMHPDPAAGCSGKIKQTVPLRIHLAPMRQPDVFRSGRCLEACNAF